MAQWQASVHYAAGERATAFRLYQEALARTLPEDMRVFWAGWHVWRPRFSVILSGLEEACGDAAAFRAICHCYREEHSFDASASVLQWYLEPSMAATIGGPPRDALDFRSDIAGLVESSGWIWQDPFNDCSWEQDAINGLIIRAVNGRDLFFLNRSAPRLVRSVNGDFVAETICAPALDDRPSSGGLLLWKDEENYLSLNWGRGGRHEICLEGCVGREDMVFGRGRLPAERTFLRLERRGARVDALCSADGDTWWSVGHASFLADDPVQIGLCAIGMIDRTVYPGAYREGTAIRFETFRLW